MYFSTVFPSGLVAGIGNSITLTSALAVENFLPQGGGPGPLILSYIDPLTTSSGVLGGQIVALKLNVMFNQAGYLGANPVPLGNLVIKFGPFAGWTVNAFLNFAEQALGGGPLNGFTYSQINDAATAINENFDNGTVNNGYLDCAENVYGKIGDFVWFDLNENGIQDAGENGIPNVVVKLFTCDDVFVDSVLTDTNGKYEFADLVPGNYYIKFELPAGYQFTMKDVGDDNYDSDVDLISGKTSCIALAPGENNSSLDAGMYYLKSSLGDKVWFDMNENGIQDAGEAGIPNVLVKLFDCSDNMIDSTFTDGNGNYLFTNLQPGSFYVKFELPSGYQFTMKDVGDDNYDSDADLISGKTSCISLAPGENNLSLDAGMYYLKSSLGDKVWFDVNENGIQDAGEAGIPNVLVKLFDCSDNFIDSTFTDNDGNYLFGNLQPGSYYVKFFAPDTMKFTLKDQGSNDLVDSDAEVLTGNSPCVTLLPNEHNLSIDAGLIYKRSSIGDFVWNDLNMNGIQDADEPGLGGIIVKLYTCDGTYLSQTVTDSLGYYSFSELLPGNYKIEVVLPAGYQFSLQNQGGDEGKDSDVNPSNSQSDCVILAANQNYNDLDAGMHLIPPPPVCSIGDKVWFDTNMNGIQDQGENGIQNILVKLLDCNGNILDSTLTDNNGNYRFDSLVAGQYKIKVIIPSGYSFSTKDAGNNDLTDSDVDPTTGETVCIVLDPPSCGENSEKWDAGIYPTPTAPTCVIGDKVWEDLNKNGIQDYGEVGVPYVTVKLLDCNGQVLATTQTNQSGYYNFNNVEQGNYKLRYVLPAGYAFTIKDTGTNDLLDSDVDLQLE